MPQRAIAETHPDPGVVERARRQLGDDVGTTNVPMRIELPRVVRARSPRSMARAARRSTSLLARASSRRAAFLCRHLARRDRRGRSGRARRLRPRRSFLRAPMSRRGRTFSKGCPSWPSDSWRAASRSAVPRRRRHSATGSSERPGRRSAPRREAETLRRLGPVVDPFPGDARPRRAVLAACPLWPDSSDLTADLAREISLREGGGAPDPKRDSGAYRYLFEHRLAPRTELYQRMFFWMAAFWGGAGDRELGQAALALAWQLADAQHAVPSHPFFVEFTAMSFEATSR